MPLLDIWSTAETAVLEMNIQQIVSMAGDGVLKDDSDCATELREFFSQVNRINLQLYAKHCLEQGFTDSGLVLQDIINEVGYRLGMSVQHGIYRGKRQQNNCDGIWKSRDWTFIV